MHICVCLCVMLLNVKTYWKHFKTASLTHYIRKEMLPSQLTHLLELLHLTVQMKDRKCVKKHILRFSGYE